MHATEIMLIPADRRLEPAGLLERAVAGDLAAFEEIVRMHEKQVLNTAWRLLGRLADAQDVAQEAFLRLFANQKAGRRQPGPALAVSRYREPLL